MGGPEPATQGLHEISDVATDPSLAWRGRNAQVTSLSMAPGVRSTSRYSYDQPNLDSLLYEGREELIVTPEEYLGRVEQQRGQLRTTFQESDYMKFTD